MTVTVPVEKLRERALQALSQLPPFSPILNRLLTNLAREDASFLTITDLIEKDTALAGNVLQLVNSALYGRRAAVNSVRHAVSLLGINKLRNAALSMSVTRLWNQVRIPSGWSMAMFNLHSVATATLSDMLAQEGAVDYAEGAFAAGLFHDLGRLLIALGLPAEYAKIIALHRTGLGSLCDCEQAVLGFTHSILAAEALARWNLPAGIRTAVTEHDDPFVAPFDGVVRLSHVIGAADAYVSALGYRIDDGPAPPREEAAQRVQDLGLLRDASEFLEGFAKEFEAVRSLF